MKKNFVRFFFILNFLYLLFAKFREQVIPEAVLLSNLLLEWRNRYRSIIVVGWNTNALAYLSRQTII